MTLLLIEYMNSYCVCCFHEFGLCLLLFLSSVLKPKSDVTFIFFGGGEVGVGGYALYTSVPVYTQSVDIHKCASIHTVS